MIKVIGDGTLEKRGDHKWLIRVCYTDDSSGVKETCRPSQTVRGTKQEARALLTAWIAELNLTDAEKAAIRKREEEEARARMTFGKYADKWQKTRTATESVRQGTLKRDAQTIRQLKRYIGETAFCDLDVAAVKEAYSQMREDGVTQNGIHRNNLKLRQVLQAAFDDGLIASNPCDKKSVKEAAKQPPVKNARKSLSVQEAARLSELLDGIGDADARAMGVRLGLNTGMRLGEVLGLTWGCVDFEKSRIHVVQQYSHGKIGAPKTKSSIRYIQIDASTLEHLRKWKKAQRAYLVNVWSKQKDETPVVTDEKGGYYDEHNYGHWFHSFCVLHSFGRWTDDSGNPIAPTRHNPDGTRVDGNGKDSSGKPYSRVNKKPRKHYSGLKFHELRHTHFTLTVADGTDIKTVQARGGWASPIIPLSVYAHALPENDQKAADGFAAILQAAHSTVLETESKGGKTA